MENVVELLFDNCARRPQQLMLVDEEKSLTYSEVCRSVIKRASYIKEAGIFNSPIIVLVDRSLESIINFFAILLSNNYYIPLDKNIPSWKLEKIIKSANVDYYISSDVDDLPIERLNCDDGSFLYEYSDFAVDFDENRYSYIVFTSGSTGEPKGVIKSHENIISFVDNFVFTFPFLKEERIANQTPFFFDASMKDIYLTLKLGATLYIPDKTKFALPSETIKYLNEKKITYICWVPSILTMIAKTKTLNYVKPEYLKYVYFVGEVFQPKYLNMWLDALPDVRFFNVYGSSEVMGVSLYYEITNHVDTETIPTGKPIAHNKVTLDEGEILIESNQVALGYLNNKHNSTFEYRGRKRILHTGDFANYDEDGNIVFSSRKDFQIKHLGYRIELQEIEATLINLDYVEQCLSIYDENSDKIILFVVLNRPIDEPVRTILTDAKSKLQFYMIPNKVVVLESLPLNANGKIDRKELKRGYQDGEY